MSTRKAVGRLKGSRDSITVEWEIADFLSLSAEVDDCHDSPSFFFCDSNWYLRVRPNGAKRYSSEGYIGVYLMKEDSGPPVTATFSLFLKVTDGREEIAKEHKRTFGNEDKGWGIAKAIERVRLMVEKSEFLPSGVLTVGCSLKCDETRGVGGTGKLLSDLKSLSISGDESDVTVRVQSEDFRLHRCILAARTSVCSSMFKHDMQEKATGVVTVVDCNPGPFRAFVQYLYTGSTDGLSTENVFGLYRTADKHGMEELKASCLEYMKLNLSVSAENVFGLYRTADKHGVEELKASCLEYMKLNLSFDTFCETLDLALQHEERDLVEHAADFLCENAGDIMVREDWRDLRRSHTEEITELVEQGFMKNCKKLKK